MSRIVELELHIGPAEEGSHPLRAALRERDSHPPRFQTLQGEVREEPWRVQQEAEEPLSQELLSLEYGLRRLPTIAPRELEPTSLLSRRAALSLFPGTVRRVAERFLAYALKDDSAQYRLTVHSTVPEALEYHWLPVLLALSSNPISWDEGQRRIAFLARYPEHPASREPFRLPLTFRVDGGRRGLRLDAFSEQALRLEVFEIEDARSSKLRSEVVHLIGRSIWTPPEEFAFGPRWPRLLVIQHKSHSWRPPQDLLVSEYLDRGAGAVLHVAGSTAHCRRFFRGFYRGVLHNQPLEQCVREALAEQPHPSVYVTLGVRDGGEYGLLFTLAAAQAHAYGTGPLPIGGPDSTTASIEALEAAALLPRPQAVEPGIRRQLRAHQRALAASIPKTRAGLDRLVRLEEGAFNRGPQVLADTARMLQEGFLDAGRLQQQRLQLVNSRSLADLLEQQDDRRLQGGFTRLLNVWLSHDAQGKPADVWKPLPWESSWLQVKVSPTRIAEAFAREFPGMMLDLAFGEQEMLRLDVCVFHDAEAVHVDTPLGELWLPRRDESSLFSTSLKSLRPGLLRLRVCVFFRDTLLQSLVVEAEVADPREPEPRRTRERPSVRYSMDYVASPDFLQLEQRSRPALSLVTNHAASGDVWLAVFSTQDEGRGGLRSGTLHTFPHAKLATHTQQARTAFEAIQGKLSNTYEEPLDATNQAERASRLVKLAMEGARLFDGLFNSTQALSKSQARALHQGLAQPGLISIARCNQTEQSIPWAMLYSLPLDAGAPKQLRLCPIFQKQLEAKQDLLDTPEACRALSDCPLRGPEARYTVCPLGFWGVQHEIEQPVKQVRARSDAELEQELSSPAFAESCQLLAVPKPPRAFMGSGAQLPMADAHYQELQQLPGWTLSRSAVRHEVIAALEQEPHILYLYCHGSSSGGVFKLVFPDGEAIEATSLTEALDSERPPFFVFLNTCESVATLPETLNDLLGKLLRLGALAVIGSEIKVWDSFARPFAQHVLRGFLSGMKLGRAFVEARRHFLRQLNPLGLAYTLHAAADVHLHGVPCESCDA